MIADRVDQDGEQMTGIEKDTLLQVNDRIQVALKGTDEEVPTTYLSRVEDVAPSDYLIEWPTSGGVRAPVRDRQVLLMTFTAQGSVYCLEACVMSRAQQPIPLLTVRRLGPARRIQRRAYVRVPAMISVELAARVVGTAVDGREAANQALIATQTVNLSGGGFAIHLMTALPLGAVFDVKLNIPEREKPLNVTAKVVRIESLAASHTYEIGFAFLGLTESTRSQIMGFVIRLQQASLVRD